VSAHRHRATYNGILFNGIYGGTNPEEPTQLDLAYQDSDYRLHKVDSSRLTVSDLHEMRQWMEGAAPNEAYEGIRLITGQGTILGTSPADVEDRAWALASAFSPANVRRVSTRELLASFPDEPEGVLPFDFRVDTAGGVRDLRWYARPFIGRPIAIAESGEGLARKFTFQLVAFDPYAFGPRRTIALTSLSGVANIITNAGTALVYPQIRVRLTASANATTTLLNATTGQSLVMDLSLSSLSPYPRNLWIMTDKGEIIDANRNSRYAIRKSGFVTDLFLQPGGNDITWDKPGGGSVESVVFYHRDAYA
jgi:hypothetical protein